MNHVKRCVAQVLLLSLLGLPLWAQTPKASPADPWKALTFLEGAWTAIAQGPRGVATTGVYTFRLELANHILARHSISDSAGKKSTAFDYQHEDLFYVYQDAPGQPLRAIYFDSEGHVIHYDVSTPASTTAVFLSDPARPGPQFRLVYDLKGSVMSGKFQIRAPGGTDWNSYLEWSGSKK